METYFWLLSSFNERKQYNVKKKKKKKKKSKDQTLQIITLAVFQVDSLRCIFYTASLI